ncbi:unnamed protein product, partial [Brachionus calyciflorus]
MKNTRKIDFSKLIKQTLEVLQIEKVNPDEIIECSARAEIIEYSKIRRISSEFKHRYRIFNETRVDCDAIKNVFDILLPETFKNGIKGFVQETSINSFKMTLFSEIQIRMWDVIQQRYPVWHFDASGLFLNEINDQSKPFLFSFVCHDPISNSFIPIAD